MLVLDASVVLEFVLGSSAGAKVAERMRDEGLAAPHFVDLEIVHTLRRLVRLGHTRASRATQALRFLSDLRLVRYPHYILLPRIWQLRENITAYDAAYVALAEALDAPLLTSDRALAATPGHDARIELL